MIQISQEHLLEIQSHGKEAYPEECCGAMLGDLDSKNGKFTKDILRIENHWVENKGESRHRRFAVTAEDYKTLERKAKEAKLTLLGFYHTHPDHPAKPSKTDLSYAWPFFSYIILSVQKGEAEELYSYTLDPEKNEFHEEALEILGLRPRPRDFLAHLAKLLLYI